MGGYFVSYRRKDSPYAGRIADRLILEFGEGGIFIDVESLRYGEDFERQLNEELDGCEAMLVVMGPVWIERMNESRLNDPSDFVRREVEHALSRDIPVIPVLVGQTRLPAAEDLPESMRALVRRQCIELDDAQFRDDVTRLVRALKGLPRGSPTRSDVPTITLAPAEEESLDLAPELAGQYAFLWLDEVFSTAAGSKQRLLVAHRPTRWLGMYDVTVGQRFVLRNERFSELPIHVLRPNVQPPRVMHIYLDPLSLVSASADPLSPKATDHIFLPDRIKQVLLP